MKIAHILKKENNNLDIIRILLASLVIVGHSPAINGYNGPWVDPVSKYFPFTYSGALAVKIFFFISGLLVTNSLLTRRSVSHYIISRSFRLMPALFVVLVITVFIFGPALTSYSLTDYFSNLNNFHYIRKNLIFSPDYFLPGVFENNLHPKAVNGSIWTLNQEVGCYMVLLGAFLIGGVHDKKYLNIIVALIILDTFLPTRILFGWMGSSPEVNLLPFSFSLGAFFAINAESTSINLKTVLGLFLVYYIFNATPFVEVILIAAASITAIYLASTKLLLRFRPKYDISYGLYLWGFLIQQTLYHLFGQLPTILHCTLALIISATLGLISNAFIEVPFIKLGRFAQARFSTHRWLKLLSVHLNLRNT